jgi:sugar phosphate isomerase/epimerase
MLLVEEFSIQLYSVRDATEKDYTGTLEKLAKMGYKGVEFAGYGGLSAKDMKQLLADNKLKPIGSHVGIQRLTRNLEEEIEYHKAVGTEYIVCPFSTIRNRDETMELAKTLKPVIAEIESAGLKFAYHNHAHEFTQDGGEYLLDILFQNLPPTAAMELDVYWAAYADVDPLNYMEKHKDRLKLLHVKQISKDKHCVDLDQGILNYKEIITKAKTLGVKHFILEQEEYAISSMVSVKNGIDYIMKLEG